MEWQWHQLDHKQIICTWLQTDNHASISSLKFVYRPDALSDAHPTASKHWRHSKYTAVESKSKSESKHMDLSLTDVIVNGKGCSTPRQHRLCAHLPFKGLQCHHPVTITNLYCLVTGTRVWTTCLELLHNRIPTRSQTRDLLTTRSASNSLHHETMWLRSDSNATSLDSSSMTFDL